MTGWLIDTTLTTGALIALVLVLRRPVARLFGPGMAYALWALPLVRLLLPPLVLPASLAPQASPQGAGMDVIMLAAPHAVAPAEAAFDWTALVLAVWLGGAALFLAQRLLAYRVMRRRLLAGARPMGREGAVRIVESAEVPAPIAFGLIDKVVALPPGFMASPDRTARDLAIAHELEHHAGHDLAANFAVQPLLALHWFNPLAWAGWRAMRRDQEAACDARVMEGCDAATRAAYGRLIAGFAQSPRLALAAPMACPVLGEKSIIHRLRSLTMSEVSPRRRLAGRAAIAAALLALPLTASISYADAGDPPAPTAAPADAAPRVAKRIVIIDKPDGGAEVDDKNLTTRVIERDGKTIVYKSAKPATDAEIEARVAEAIASMPEPPLPPAPPAVDGVTPPAPPAPPVPPAPGQRRERRIVMIENGGGIHAFNADEVGGIDLSCADGASGPTVESSASQGGRNERVRMRFCSHGAAKTHALEGLRRARERLSADRNLSDTIRADVLRRLDAEIAKLSRQG